jgi:hypothetical protein
MYSIFYISPYNYEIEKQNKNNNSHMLLVEEIHNELIPLFKTEEPTESPVYIIQPKPKNNYNHTNKCNCSSDIIKNRNLIIITVTTSLCGLLLILLLVIYKFYYKKKYIKNNRITEVNTFGIESNNNNNNNIN